MKELYMNSDRYRGRVLVTGMNGLLGTNTAHALAAAGYEVRGLLRRRASYRGIASDRISLYEGDFTDVAVLADAMEGCSAVIHCAACTSQNASEEEYSRVNVIALHNLLDMAASLGIRRVVYISSANIFGYGTKDRPGDGSCPTMPPFTSSGYAMSKARARQVVREFRDRMEIVTLCPTFMIGPYDSKPGSGRIILMGYRRRIVFCPPGGKNFVPVQDVAAAAVSALVKGVPGKEYIVAGENLSYREFYRLLAECTGVRSLRVCLPEPVMMAAGLLGDWMHGTFGVRTELSQVNMRLLCTGNYYVMTDAAVDLGVRCRPVEEAVGEAVSWFRHEGMCRR